MVAPLLAYARSISFRSHDSFPSVKEHLVGFKHFRVLCNLYLNTVALFPFIRIRCSACPHARKSPLPNWQCYRANLDSCLDWYAYLLHQHAFVFSLHEATCLQRTTCTYECCPQKAVKGGVAIYVLCYCCRRSLGSRALEKMRHPLSCVLDQGSRHPGRCQPNPISVLFTVACPR